MNPRKLALVVLATFGLMGTAGGGSGDRNSPTAAEDLFGSLQIAPARVQQFWSEPAAKRLLALSPKAVSDLVPVQAGLRFCRCPACGARERDEPLTWTLEQPTVLRCRRCGVAVPDDRFPAKSKDQGKVPEETVEVLPGVIHRYPYHAVEEAQARYPDERLYLQARIDYETRRYLARAALFAALGARRGEANAADSRLETLACVLLLRFAQVYPGYAIHHDQPDRPKTLQPARLLPPYQSGYQTAKWEWSGSLEVPIDLVMAYSLLRGSPGWDTAGKLLGDPLPSRTVERELFRAAAEFASNQPREVSVEGLLNARGILAVARLLDDQGLAGSARRRLEELTRQGFYHDGVWREAETSSHRRVVGLLEGWVAKELTVSAPAPLLAASARPDSAGNFRPLLELARLAGAAMAPRSRETEVRQAAWPDLPASQARGRPVLFGGAGIARLVLGHGTEALEAELLGQDSYSKPRFHRLALRVAVGGEPVLDDLEERGATGTGWELSTPSHNLVVVDGLNQRETPGLAGEPAAGSNLLFFAAEPDFQVVSMGDPRAYPQSTTRYRQTVILSGSARARYALTVFEVHGGLQHDQIFHAARQQGEAWSLSEPTVPAPSSLLPPTIRFVPGTPAEQGRWFVQAYGEFRPDQMARLAQPSLAVLDRRLPGPAEIARASHHALSGPVSSVGVRLHLLGDFPATGFTALSPGPAHAGEGESRSLATGRPSLIVRRRSEQGETLRSSFVTLIEPTGPAFPPLRRAGRVDSPPEVVVVLVQTVEETEYLLVNLEPGTIRRVQLPSGRYVSFDGLALRVRDSGVTLAGGTFAEGSGKLASLPILDGTITGAVRQPSPRGNGWFVTPSRIDTDPTLSGKTLVLTHGDGTRRAWTLNSIEPIPQGTRLHVREEPGFSIDLDDGSARYDRFPALTVPGPHRFQVFRIARG